MATPPRKRASAKKSTARKPGTTRSATKAAAASQPAKKATPRRATKRSAAREPKPIADEIAEVIDAIIEAHSPDVDGMGAVERATRIDLAAWKVGKSALSQAAYAMARQVDGGEGSSVAAGRELRMMVAAAKADKSMRPVSAEVPTEDDGNVVPETALERLRRERAAARR